MNVNRIRVQAGYSMREHMEIYVNGLSAMMAQFGMAGLQADADGDYMTLAKCASAGMALEACQQDLRRLLDFYDADTTAGLHGREFDNGYAAAVFNFSSEST